MKNLIFTLCAFMLGLGAVAQNQNGYMKYSLNVEGENAEMMAVAMPTTMELFFGYNKSLLRMSGGMASMLFGDILSDNAKSDTAYMIMHPRQLVYLMPADKKTEAPAKTDLTVTTEKTGKTEKISGYNAEEYKITTTTNNKTVTHYLWASKDIKMPKPEAAANGSQFGAMFGYKIEGFPVRYQILLNEGGVSLTTTVTLMEYNQKEQPRSLFEVPAKYKREIFSPEKLMR